MAMHQSVQFGINVVGDGSATSITITLATAAITFQYPLVGNNAQLSTKFDVGSLTPTSLDSIVSGDGQTVSYSIGLLGTTITFTWPIAISDHTNVFLYGNMNF